MLFNSWVFLAFLAVVFALYYGVIGRLPWRGMAQVLFLVAASLVFYAYENPWLLILLGTSLLINGLGTRLLISESPGQGQRRRVLAALVILNLAGIAFFKYASLLANTLLPGTALDGLLPMLHDIPLPIGISFYTFEGLSIVIDAYQRRVKGFEPFRQDIREGKEWRFQSRIWLFMTFFPHLVAGPIVRAHDFVHQIGHKRLREIDWAGAVRCLITGFFLKMVCADNLKEATALIDPPHFEGLSSLTLLALLYGFSFQIFADFAGYSLIAMGLARLFGYQFCINFNFPYLSASLTEFWTRWHISLSTWLRDYLYIPLGGSRRGAARTYVNLFLVMFLGGLWHGAAWSYAVWGTAHGIGLAVERALRGPDGRPKPRAGGGLKRWLGIFITFNVVSLLWLLFKLPDFSDVLAYVKALGRGTGGIAPQTAYLLAVFSAPVILYHAWGGAGAFRERVRQRAGTRVIRLVEGVLLAVLLFLILTNSGSPGAFIYFQF